LSLREIGQSAVLLESICHSFHTSGLNIDDIQPTGTVHKLCYQGWGGKEGDGHRRYLRASLTTKASARASTPESPIGFSDKLDFNQSKRGELEGSNIRWVTERLILNAFARATAPSELIEVRSKLRGWEGNHSNRVMNNVAYSRCLIVPLISRASARATAPTSPSIR
jgi:hypothetical protein